VFLDCDVVFERGDWLEPAVAQLDRFPLVQPFSHLHRMPEDWLPAHGSSVGYDVLRSPAYFAQSGIPVATWLGMPAEQVKCSTGTAWAMRRALLDDHGIYDACIVGGGDSAFIRAAYGRMDDAMRLHHMNSRRREHYLSWAIPFHEAVRANVGFVEGNLRHLWHGQSQDRAYRARIEGLERFEFDPYTDIALDPDGAWRWSSNKHEMHDYVRGYFASRREDG
jgi:hypothetical protein